MTIEPLNGEETLATLKPKIGDYGPIWKVLRLRARQTGCIPAKLFPIAKRFFKPEKPYFIERTAQGTLFVGDVRDNYSVHCAVSPDPDDELVSFLTERTKTSGGALLDIGTNVGVVAASVAKRLAGSGLEVVAFEPVPDTAQRAAATFALNGLKNIRLFPIAVGGEDTTIPFYVAQGHSEGASANRNAYVETHGFTEIQVACRRLDSIAESLGIGKIGFMKIDVEGFEPQVIAGAQATIGRHRPHMLFEYHPDIAGSVGWKPTDVSGKIAEAAGGDYAFHVLGEGNERRPYPPSESGSLVNVYCEPLPVNAAAKSLSAV